MMRGIDIDQGKDAQQTYCKWIQDFLVQKMSWGEYLDQKLWVHLKEVIKIKQEVLDNRVEQGDVGPTPIERQLLFLPQSIGLGGMDLYPWSFLKTKMDAPISGEFYSWYLSF